MATQVQSAGWSYRFGRAARRALHGYSRSEHQMAGWLVSNGLSAGPSWGVVWAVRFAVAGVLLYAAFWLAIVLLIALVAAWHGLNRRADDGDDWGFPTWEELRWSPGYDPVPYEDIEHPDYPDKRLD